MCCDRIVMIAFLFLATAVALAGCGKDGQTASSPQLKKWQAPALPSREQELILNRAVELMKASGKWQGYPLESMGFDDERKQWKCVFSERKPDAGYAVFIKDQNATRIDILLLPPLWTKYERKESSNEPQHARYVSKPADRDAQRSHDGD